MDRRPFTILLALAIAAQACLGGLALCSSGGRCHTEHVEIDRAVAHTGCGHEPDLNHSIFVDIDESHHCACRDIEIDAHDAVPGKRSDLSIPATLTLVSAVLARDASNSSLRAAERRHPRARGDTAQSQRLAAVRATRLLL